MVVRFAKPASAGYVSWSSQNIRKARISEFGVVRMLWFSVQSMIVGCGSPLLEHPPTEKEKSTKHWLLNASEFCSR